MIRSAYIHIPFCQQICHYCDFTKFFYNKELADQYLHALEKEIVQAVGTKNKQMRTIFVGGGTPTALSHEQLEKLLIIISNSFDVHNCEEYTFEANPGEFDEEKLVLLKKYGVNRISFGVQSFDDEMLEKLGRSHRVSDVYNNLKLFEKLNFKNVSVDLMYGLPGQSYSDFEKTLKEAIDLDLPHYSSYSLQIEPKTVFYLKHKKGKITKPVEEEEAAMYELLMREMEKKGIRQYEISNFAKPGFESKHNLTYWNNDYYYGFGAGSHGYLPGERTVNIKPLNQYISKALDNGEPRLHVEKIEREDEIEEQMFLGLRKAEGVSKGIFQKRFELSMETLYKDELDYLKRKEWIEETDEFVRLTEQGRLFGNSVFQEFLLEEEKIKKFL